MEKRSTFRSSRPISRGESSIPDWMLMPPIAHTGYITMVTAFAIASFRQDNCWFQMASSLSDGHIYVLAIYLGICLVGRRILAWLLHNRVGVSSLSQCRKITKIVSFEFSRQSLWIFAAFINASNIWIFAPKLSKLLF